MSNLKVTVTLIGDVEHSPVEIINPDRVRWDITSHKHKWPDFAAAPFLGTTFLAWAAMRRLQLYSGDFETFRDHECLSVDIIDDDSDDDSNDGIGTPFQ